MTGIQWMYVPNSHLTSDKPRKSVMVGPPVMPDKRLQVCIKRFEVQALSTTGDRKSTRLNSSHSQISYAVFCLKNTNTIGGVVLQDGPDSGDGLPEAAAVGKLVQRTAAHQE